jgi:hypothetical protein
MLVATAVGQSALTADMTNTFARDVAPIFRAKCQTCHRPDGGAPMSLLTYEDARPWAQSIKRRVMSREMPPWHLQRGVGIQLYKNDRSLTDAQIDTIVRWVDAGAALGDVKELPPPVKWPNGDAWAIGTPDLVVQSPTHIVAANGPDWWGDYTVSTGLTEDRYVRAIQTMPSRAGRRVIHHALTFLIQEDGSGDADSYLSEFAVGKYEDTFPGESGRLMKAGSKLRFNMHYHSIGEEIADRTSVAFAFYPKGYVPRHDVANVNVGLLLLDNELDIPANAVATHRAAYRLPRAARIISFQPHMHLRGKAMTLDAVRRDGTREALGAVDRYDFNWQVAYIFDDQVAPLLPAGTLLEATATFDNTAGNRRNPDPNLWVGFGNRSVDEMFQCHVLLTYLDDAEYFQLRENRERAHRVKQE